MDTNAPARLKALSCGGAKSAFTDLMCFWFSRGILVAALSLTGCNRLPPVASSGTPPCSSPKSTSVNYPTPTVRQAEEPLKPAPIAAWSASRGNDMKIQPASENKGAEQLRAPIAPVCSRGGEQATQVSGTVAVATATAPTSKPSVSGNAVSALVFKGPPRAFGSRSDGTNGRLWSGFGLAGATSGIVTALYFRRRRKSPYVPASASNDEPSFPPELVMRKPADEPSEPVAAVNS